MNTKLQYRISPDDPAIEWELIAQGGDRHTNRNGEPVAQGIWARDNGAALAAFHSEYPELCNRYPTLVAVPVDPAEYEKFRAAYEAADIVAADTPPVLHTERNIDQAAWPLGPGAIGMGRLMAQAIHDHLAHTGGMPVAAAAIHSAIAAAGADTATYDVGIQREALADTVRGMAAISGLEMEEIIAGLLRDLQIDTPIDGYAYVPRGMAWEEGMAAPVLNTADSGPTVAPAAPDTDTASRPMTLREIADIAAENSWDAHGEYVGADLVWQFLADSELVAPISEKMAALAFKAEYWDACHRHMAARSGPAAPDSAIRAALEMEEINAALLRDTAADTLAAELNSLAAADIAAGAMVALPRAVVSRIIALAEYLRAAMDSPSGPPDPGPWIAGKGGRNA